MWPIENQGKLTQGRGLTESVQTIHIKSIHKCSAVQEAMVKLTNGKRMCFTGQSILGGFVQI